jgi:hypothetical protein
MRGILGSRKHHYLRSVSALLIAVALVIGIISCTDGTVPTMYTLTMAVDPPGSGEAIDVTGAEAYEAGAAVAIEAEPEEGYTFGEWTAPTGTFEVVDAATTTFFMPSQDVTITAKFRIPLDHFKCYHAPRALPHETVFLEDQFVTIDATLNWTQLFCNPAEKVHNDIVTPILHSDNHLTVYNIQYEGQFDLPGHWEVVVDNQFGANQELSVEGGPWFLAVPTQKLEPGDHGPPSFLDHFLVYRANGPQMEVDISLNDEFGDEQIVSSITPFLFANPCRKTHDGTVTEIKDPEAHLVFYVASFEDFFEFYLVVDNQFGLQELDVANTAMLMAVPSEMLSVEYVEHD